MRTFLRIRPGAINAIQARRVVANSISFVLPLVAKAQSFRCSSFPHQTHFVGLWRVPCWRPPLDPRGNVLGHSDVLCANHLATVRLTRLSRLRRSAYPLASACCGCSERQPILCNHPTSKFAGHWLFNECYEPTALRAVQSSPWKQCEARHGRA